MRMNFLNPEEVLNEIELKNDMVAADFGCGSGGFTLPLAKRLYNGIVYALDVQELPLTALKSKAAMENITNINFIHCDIEKKTSIMESSLDLAVITNVFFQIEDKKSLILEAKRLLKKDGRLLVVDWNNSSENILPNQKISAEEIKKIGKEAGLKIEKEFEAGAYHYGILFRSP